MPSPSAPVREPQARHAVVASEPEFAMPWAVRIAITCAMILATAGMFLALPVGLPHLLRNLDASQMTERSWRAAVVSASVLGMTLGWASVALLALRGRRCSAPAATLLTTVMLASLEPALVGGWPLIGQLPADLLALTATVSLWLPRSTRWVGAQAR